MNTDGPRADPTTHDLSANARVIGPVEPPGLHVMSWNVRRRVRHFIPRPVDRWDRRAPGVKELLRVERPALLGVQEALPDQAEFIGDALGGEYRRVGRGREADGGEEGCPIYYDGERLELLDWHQAALSDQPASPGTRSWGNLIPRILVSAEFVDRSTSRHFMAVNTHLDHLSARSRLRSAQAIADLVADSALPAVVTGDFNAGATSAPLLTLLSDGTLAETWAAARTHAGEEWDTHARYEAPRRNGKRIDWILASTAFRVERAAINPNRHAGGWPSDHLPVQAVLVLPGNTDSE